MKKFFFILLTGVIVIPFITYASSGDDSDSAFTMPQYSKPTELLWGGVNNGDIFDENGPVIDEMLDQLAKANLRILRVLIDFRLEMDEDGNPLPTGTYNDCILNWIDLLMVKAKARGILLLITLQAHNWIMNNEIGITKSFYEWRRCKTPYQVYLKSLSHGKQIVYGPYAERGWSGDYLTNADAKNAYKTRAYHILNHYNFHFKKRWKDLDDIIWAWALQSEPDLLPNSPVDDLRDWFDEMATYVKSIDPDTYIALGTKFSSVALALGDIKDADIYTFHSYEDISGLGKDIRDFKEEIGKPYRKLLLVEEFNPGANHKHTPDYSRYREDFEKIMEVCRKNRVPWMFWEHGYQFDADDIWHANAVTTKYDKVKEHSDGVFWGAKIIPGSKKIWQSAWHPDSGGKIWKVHKMVYDICSSSNPACNTGKLHFIDTFSNVGPPGSDYTIFDEDNKDIYFLPEKDEYGYLRIEADKRQDLWGGTPPKTGAPLVLHDAPAGGYYSVETFVSADPTDPTPSQALNTQMGLFVFQDVDNWIFFGLTNHNFTIGSTHYQADGLIVTLTKNGKSSIATIKSFKEDFVFLKIDHRADLWRFSWKRENGDPWHNMWSIFITLKEHKVGIGLKTLDLFPQPGYPGQANFDYFLIGSP